MKFVYKVQFFILISVVVFNLLITNAFAQEKIPNPVKFATLGGLISNASAITTPLAIVGLIGTVIYGGYTRMTAMGSPDKEQKSSAILVAAFVGFAIIAFAPLLVKIVGNLLGVKTDVIN